MSLETTTNTTSTSTTTSMSSFTPVEQSKLTEFRARITKLNLALTEEQSQDYNLIRWLRARNLNVKKAEEMLVAHVKWYQDNKVAGIVQREKIPEKYNGKMPFAHLGMDPATGCPVFLFLMGRHDMRTIIEEDGVENMLRMNMLFMEMVNDMMRDNAKKVGHPVTQFMEILDCEGYSYRQFGTAVAREAMAKMQKMFDDNYPEAMRHATIINAPKIFSWVFSIMKPLIPKATLEKIEIYGPDKETWMKVLREKYPMELVPRHWGGTLEGNDEYCSEGDIWFMGPLGKQFFSGEDSEGFIQAQVKRRDKLHLDFIVAEPGLLLEWEFKSVHHDVGFGLLYEGKDKIIPVERVESQTTVQVGQHKCERSGVYTVVFDNSYSFSRSKTVFYKVNLN